MVLVLKVNINFQGWFIQAKKQYATWSWVRLELFSNDCSWSYFWASEKPISDKSSNMWEVMVVMARNDTGCQKL